VWRLKEISDPLKLWKGEIKITGEKKSRTNLEKLTGSSSIAKYIGSKKEIRQRDRERRMSVAGLVGKEKKKAGESSKLERTLRQG